jgi:hypothetical protein
MVTTVRREIARKHANAPVRSPPNVMRPRPWEHVQSNDTETVANKNHEELREQLQSRYHLPDRST